MNSLQELSDPVPLRRPNILPLHSFTFQHSFYSNMSTASPQVRRRPTKHRARPDSNVVRASVLETALELGIAHNSTVANWIFNSPLAEESEELDDIPPETEIEEVR